LTPETWSIGFVLKKEEGNDEFNLTPETWSKGSGFVFLAFSGYGSPALN
jgi:hypothetical protein